MWVQIPPPALICYSLAAINPENLNIKQQLMRQNSICNLKIAIKTEFADFKSRMTN